jgi:CHAT domain-containing protein
MSNWSQPEAACQVAELSRQLNKLAEAEAAYQRAVNMIETIYVTAQRTGVREGFLEAKVAVYPRLASLLAEQNRWGDSFAAAEAGRSRALLDMLGNAPARETGAACLSPELLKQDRKFATQMCALSRQAQMAAFNPQIDTRSIRQEYRQLQAEYDRFRNTVALEHPGYAVFQTIQTVTEEDLQRLFADNPRLKQSAILSYLVSDDAVIGYCFNGSHLHGQLLSVGAAELRREIDQLRSQIAARDAGWHEHAGLLHDLLIEPFASQIADKQQLLMMPHQSLHLLPFALLCNDSKQTLVERFKICTVPSASILELWSQPNREEYAVLSDAKALVIANPDGSLPFAEREVQSVKRAYPEAAALIGDAAQEEKVVALAPTFDILHIATHGYANPVRPDYSHLKLAHPNGDTDLDDGLLDVHEIVRRLDVRATRLVVLSACETAMGPASRGDEVQSLANAFLCAGAQQVVATLWAVDDQATAEFMDDFYAALRDSHSPASAMRSSMLRRVKAGRHPYEWGAFQLIGLH